MLLGCPIRLDLASVQRKLVDDGRGGYCYEHNLLFRSVLEALGFSVRSCAGRVLWGRDESVMPPRTHMCLLVEINGEPDVGFGGMTLSAPLALQTGLEQITPHGALRIESADANGSGLSAYVLQALVDSRWMSVYRFDSEPQYPADYEMSNHYVSTYPESIFVPNLLAARLGPASASASSTALFHRTTNANKHDIANVAVLRRVLTEEIGIRLPEPADELDTVLARLP